MAKEQITKEKGFPFKEQAIEAATRMEKVSGRVCEVYYDAQRQIHKWTFRITENEK